jgi:hypothetical protein
MSLLTFSIWRYSLFAKFSKYILCVLSVYARAKVQGWQFLHCREKAPRGEYSRRPYSSSMANH